MTFQRVTVALLILVAAGLAAGGYATWRIYNRLNTAQAFIEGYLLPEAVAACEKTESSTPFKWNGGTRNSVVGLNSIKLDKNTIIASYTLLANGVYCDYDPIKRKASIGSNFLERD
jgi:hypothetical protein